jgi:hypothetical protein
MAGAIKDYNIRAIVIDPYHLKSANSAVIMEAPKIV